jgi:uncharacterized membrane protein
MVDTILLYILYFFFYSNVGWFFESLYCSLAAGKWINRGFLTGPLCPIYGAGALVLSVFLSPVKDKWYLVFFLGIILCDIVEFITSVILEKLFHARWWDYSDKFLNIQGRICFRHSIIWGFASLLFVKLIHPFFSTGFELIPAFYRNILLGIILAVFFIDLAGAVAAAADIRKFNKRLQAFRTAFVKATDNMRTGVEGAAATVQESFSKRGKKLASWTQDMNRQFEEMKAQFEEIRKSEDTKRVKTARMFSASKQLLLSPSNTFKSIEEIFNELKKRIKDENDDEMS